MNQEPLTLGDDVRMELASAASNTERRNRPRGLIVLGALALLGAIGFLAYGVMARASAAEARDAQAGQLSAIQTEVERLLSLKERQRQLDLRLAPDSGIKSQLESLAEGAGMKPIVVTETTEGSAASGVGRRKYTILLEDQPAQGVLQWLSGSAAISGLSVTSIDLSPDLSAPEGTPEGSRLWRGTVAFSRYERR